ncbi:hybrid sensor histidine kinase/response regulator [Alloyangia pacifica]|uniref:histidine kinase n=1 Tax=Alloyangia pacifica TaxID=311180 RepID=A0A1I6VY29_9RHOB|nr:ATP-binding protein [Alloyangia pacifica]SDI19288.1 two-component system, NtrC family, sensor kinase [Alloyangia pacifica]SFT18589.1 two-component system, NtrC family, sensor kinase [Alloyangia pacifica]
MAVRFDPSVPEAGDGPARRPSDMLEEVIDALTEGLAIFDENAVLLRFNAGFSEMNPAVADLLAEGLDWSILLREWVMRGGLSAGDAERLSFMEARLAGGDWMVTPLEIEAGDRVTEILLRSTAAGGFVLVQSDVTERRAFEETERAADQLVRKVLESCPANIIMSRVGDGEVIYRSPAATELLGSAEHTHAHFASRAERADFITAVLPDGRVDDMPVTGIRADGARFPSLVSARLIQYRGEDVLVSSTIDVSKEVELRRRLAAQREQIFQAEKMSALGELLAGVAHELNNPLSVVVGHALMLRDEDISDDVLRRVEKISDAAERCARIVKSFLAMARQQPARLVPMDISETVETAVGALSQSAEGLGAEVSLDISPDLPPVRGDAHQIAQVVINLVTNADQAIGESGTGGRIDISLTHDAAAQMVELRVADDGPGIPKGIRSRIFDPLFTTKPVGSGTGIGLALCHRIVTAHSGVISLAEGGQGATLLVRLPTTEADAGNAPSQKDAEISAGRGAVLVVDDEEDVSDLIREILLRDGFEVTVANSAETALDLLAGQDFALILTDLNMPGLGGRGFYERLLRDLPAMARRMGFVTGDTMSPQARGFLDGAGRPFLEKPIAPDELRRLARTMLEGGA